MSIQSLRTGRRIQSSSTIPTPESPPGTSAENESDSNADTCCLGTNFCVLEYTTRTADVYPYDDSYKPLTNVPIVTGATAWTDPVTSITYVLIFHESLFYGTKLDHSLINPNQVRHNDIDFWDNPYDSMHELSLQVDDGPTIPLTFRGTKLSFSSRVPTKEELANCKHVDMTSRHPWNPESVHLGALHTMQTSHNVHRYSKVSSIGTTSNPFSQETITTHAYVIPDSDDAILHQIEPSLVELRERCIKALQVGDDVPARRTFVSTDRHNRTTAIELSERWGIGLKRANDTIKATTQRAVRSAILPISRRYRADRMYRVKRLQGKFATDTIYSNIKSLKQNTCAQVFSSKIGFIVCYPMTKADGQTAGFALQDFSHDFGVPDHLTFDGAMVQVGRKTRFMKFI